MTIDAPEIRVREMNSAAVRRDADFVLYWMIANRRSQWNFSLDRAVSWSSRLGKPVLVFEALRVAYRWASDRIHQFVIEGMADNSAAFAELGVAYFPYLEPEAGAGRGLLEALAKHACVVVTDDFPCFFLPQMVAVASKRLDVRVEAIDSNGLYPLRDSEIVFSTAHQFRRHLQKNLPPHLGEFPAENALQEARDARGAEIPRAVSRSWRIASLDKISTRTESLEHLPIDHSVTICETRGGCVAANDRMKAFLHDRLKLYAEHRNDPDQDAASGLSPYLHFGHISTHQIFAEATSRERWTPAKLNPKAHGSREDWWRTSPPLESFLDELVAWRELGFHFCARVPNYDQYDTLPEWAKCTLDSHCRDKREHQYTLEAFESAKTFDPLWNAAQRQLCMEGKIHNYLRMLWGKKILEWSKSPQAALEIMIELNNKYALDGRNPNSYSGIFWTLGRFDRAWGPERPIFGTVRYMSSDNTARKLNVKRYLTKYAEPLPLFAQSAKQTGRRK